MITVKQEVVLQAEKSGLLGPRKRWYQERQNGHPEITCSRSILQKEGVFVKAGRNSYSQKCRNRRHFASIAPESLELV